MFSPELVRVFVDPKFGPAEPVIPIVAAAYVFCGIAYCARTGTFVTGKTGTLAALSIATALLNLGLNWALIPIAGMMGAAWATLVSFGALAAANYWFSQRIIRLPLGIYRVLTAVALACGLYVLARWSIPVRMDLAIPLKCLLLLLFPMMLWKAGVFSVTELETLRAIASGLRSRSAQAMPPDSATGLLNGYETNCESKHVNGTLPMGGSGRQP
jgi:O-antigen/teichoic acid export membrane protein